MGNACGRNGLAENRKRGETSNGYVNRYVTVSSLQNRMGSHKWLIAALLNRSTYDFFDVWFELWVFRPTSRGAGGGELPDVLRIVSHRTICHSVRFDLGKSLLRVLTGCMVVVGQMSPNNGRFELNLHRC
jgi:hypothetical protein